MTFDPVNVVLISDSEPVISAVRMSVPSPNQLAIFSLKDVVLDDMSVAPHSSPLVQVATRADVVFIGYSFDQSPVIGGLCFRLRQTCNVPIIAITGGGQDEMITALLSGVDDVVTLPIFLPFIQAKIGAFRRLMRSVKKLSSARLKKKLKHTKRSLIAARGTIVEEHIESLGSSVVQTSESNITALEELVSDILEETVDEVTTTFSAAVDDEIGSTSPFQQFVDNSEKDKITIGDLTIDFDSHRFFVDGEELELTPKEFGLLAFLMARPGTACSRDEILDSVWGINFETGTNMVDVYMHFVRRKLESVGKKKVIQTVRGLGYRFDPDTA